MFPFANQHDITEAHAAGEGQLSIIGPVKGVNLPGSKRSERPGGPAINRLQPYVGAAVSAVQERDSTAVTGPANIGVRNDGAGQFKQAKRFSSFGRKYGQLPLRVIRTGAVPAGNFSVATRNGGVRGHTSGELLRRATGDRNSP